MNPNLINAVQLTLYQRYSLCSNIAKLHWEISTLKSVFKRNGYPKNFINLHLKNILDILIAKNKVSLTVPKLKLVCIALYR